jgi:NAD(P)-dependent dehydrogenase (short-subunit alcohol dehydrogenase family)
MVAIVQQGLLLCETIKQQSMKKVVFITGTNSGFGWLTAHSVAALGHTVYATMRDTEGKNKDKAIALGNVPNITVLDVAVTNNQSVTEAINGIIEKEGRIDVVVNNAGYFGGGLAESYTTEDVQEMFDVHVTAAWRSIKAALPTMRHQGEGLIINISSGLGRFSAPFMTIYNAAKFAVEGLSEGLHYEVRPLGVDVAIIEPGAFPTDIFGKTKTGSDNEVVAGYGELANIPAKIGEGMGQLFEAVKPNPQLVADAIVQLIETPKGQRPLRTVVDPATGSFTETANQAVKVQYDNFLTAFGMQDLLK